MVFPSQVPKLLIATDALAVTTIFNKARLKPKVKSWGVFVKENLKRVK